jgi:hypothetical protein
MPDDKDTKACVFLLIQYCERLLNDRAALLALAQTSVPHLQERRTHARLEIEKKMEPVFHTFHAFLREENWQGLQNMIRQVLDSELEK